MKRRNQKWDIQHGRTVQCQGHGEERWDEVLFRGLGRN